MMGLLNFILFVALPGAVAQGPVTQTLVYYPPSEVFIPFGFDDNDNVQVVLRGEYTSTCFETGREFVSIDQEAKTIRVDNQAYYKEGDCFCVFMSVPFKKVLNLGRLSPGDYTLEVRKPENPMDPQTQYKVMGQVSVKKSDNEGPDDQLYAPIQEAFLENPQGPAPYSLRLRGTLRNSCLEVGKVMVKESGDGVALIQPLLNFEEKPEGCKEEERFFEQTVVLPSTLKGHTLIHIRVVDGQALNRVVELK